MPQPGVLGRHFFQDIPRAESNRTHLARQLDLTRIDQAIRQANAGRMRALTDLARETVSVDGHLSALVQKRILRVIVLDWEVKPAAAEEGAEGTIDQDKAEIYAAFVRAQLNDIPNFREALLRLAWAIFDGRAASEIDWRPWGGDWHVVGLNWIHPRRLSFGPNRDLRVIDSNNDNGGFRDEGFELDRHPYKFITYTPQLFCDYQEREGLAPRAVYWSFFQRFGVRERMALLELFGRPWRILEIDPLEASVNIEGIRQAYQDIKNLGGQGSNTARLPRGLKLNIQQPFTGAGQVSGEAIDDARKVLSKLFLGSTGTTDAVSTGLGSSIGDAHLSEEDLIVWSDAQRLAEVIEDKLTDAIIANNFGPGELAHAPKFSFRTEAPLDSAARAARVKNALDCGLPVPLEQARKELGIDEVRDGEPYLVRVRRPAEFGQLAPEPANEVVYPTGEAPEPGEVADLPAVAINVPGGGGGSPGPTSKPAPGTPKPEPTPLPARSAELSDDEPDHVAALAEEMTRLQVERCEHNKSNRCPLCGVKRKRWPVRNDDGSIGWEVAWMPITPIAAPIAPAA